MRLSIHGSLRKGTRELHVSPQGREAPNYAQIRVLRSSEEPFVARLANEQESRSGHLTLCYDVSGLRSLRSCLKSGTGQGLTLLAMLAGMVELLSWCSTALRGTALVLFDPQYVYVDARGAPVFVVVPLKGCSSQEEQSPLVLLEALAEVRNARKADPNERELARRLSEFVGGEGQAFSLNRLRSFVKTLDEDASIPQRSVSYEVSTVEATRRELLNATGSRHDVPTDHALRRPRDPRDAIEARGNSTTVTQREMQMFGKPGDWREGRSPSEVSARRKTRMPTGTAYVLCDREGSQVASLQPGRVYEVGRGQSCDVRLERCPKVSRRHATIRCLAEGVVLRDLGSTNGSYVAGVRCKRGEEVLVGYGQKFFLSDREFSVERSR